MQEVNDEDLWRLPALNITDRAWWGFYYFMVYILQNLQMLRFQVVTSSAKDSIFAIKN